MQTIKQMLSNSPSSVNAHRCKSPCGSSDPILLCGNIFKRRIRSAVTNWSFYCTMLRAKWKIGVDFVAFLLTSVYMLFLQYSLCRDSGL